MKSSAHNLEAITKRELRRHHISERDHLVADALCEVSFGLGLTSVKIPSLQVLGDIVGLPKQHVHTSLRRLHEMRIVRIQHTGSAWLYTVNPVSETWKCAPRVSLATVEEATEKLRELNDIRRTQPDKSTKETFPELS